jgi:hypothetical protein
MKYIPENQALVDLSTAAISKQIPHDSCRPQLIEISRMLEEVHGRIPLMRLIPRFFEAEVLHSREAIEAQEEDLSRGADATPVAFAPRLRWRETARLIMN